MTWQPLFQFLANQHAGEQAEGGVFLVKAQASYGGRRRRKYAARGVQPVPFLKQRKAPV